jgi:ribosomal protein S27E
MREGNITCKSCGAEYELYKVNIPMRDRDSEECEICGTTLIS